MLVYSMTSLYANYLVYWVCDIEMFKAACPATETSMNFGCGKFETTLSRHNKDADKLTQSRKANVKSFLSFLNV